MISTDEHRTVADDPHVEGQSQFAWEWRTMAVALFCVLPGGLFGVLVRLMIPDGGPANWWLVGGGVLGAIAGGLLEAEHWP